jgi:hypothetical protein
MAVVPHENATEVLEPGKQALDFPAVSISPQGSSILGWGFASVVVMGCDEFDPLLGQLLIQFVAVVGSIPD